MNGQDMTSRTPGNPAADEEKSADANANRLLVLDDNRQFIALVTRHGRQLGYDTLGVATTKEFIAAFVDFNPSVVILDLFLETDMSVSAIEFLGARRFAGSVIFASGFDFRYLSSFSEMAKQMGLNVLGTVQKGGNANQIPNFLERARVGSTCAY